MQSPAHQIHTLVESIVNRPDNTLAEITALTNLLGTLRRAALLRLDVIKACPSPEIPELMKRVRAMIDDARQILVASETPAQRAFEAVHEIFKDCKTAQETDDLHRVLNTLTMTASCREAMLSMVPGSRDRQAVQNTYDRWLEKARKKAYPEET